MPEIERGQAAKDLLYRALEALAFTLDRVDWSKWRGEEDVRKIRDEVDEFLSQSLKQSPLPVPVPVLDNAPVTFMADLLAPFKELVRCIKMYRYSRALFPLENPQIQTHYDAMIRAEARAREFLEMVSRIEKTAGKLLADPPEEKN